MTMMITMTKTKTKAKMMMMMMMMMMMTMMMMMMMMTMTMTMTMMMMMMMTIKRTAIQFFMMFSKYTLAKLASDILCKDLRPNQLEVCRKLFARGLLPKYKRNSTKGTPMTQSLRLSRVALLLLQSIL